MSDSENRQSSERVPLFDAVQEIDLPDLPGSPGVLGCEPRRFVGSFHCSDRKAARPALPLASVDVSASVVDRIASVTVIQKFVNQLSEPIEAVYIFPLAGSSSVSKFQMKVGERTIDGVVKERAKARQEYQAAIDEGKRAAILEQERDDVFTAQVGNIMPGEEITVTIVYSESLTYFASGHTEIRLPLVVAPRYVAGTPVDGESVGDGVELDTDLVPDASRITPPRLAPGFDPKVSLSINVAIEVADDAQLEDLLCSQHATKSGFSKASASSEKIGSHIIKVALVKEDEHLDRDFVLSWKLAGSDLSSAGLISGPVVMSGTDTAFRYGMVSINPPALDSASTKVVPRDVVFLLDRSGSMAGLKMSSAARSIMILLNTLRPDDRFAICSFDDRREWLTVNADLGESFGAERRDIISDSRLLLPASLKSIERGITYLRSVEARGGTEVQAALEDCFDVIQKTPKPAKGKAKRQAVVVLITDGEVADESNVLQSVQARMNSSRIFTVGVDTAVNDGFLKRLAQLGGGTCTLVPPGDALENALVHVAREIGMPLITDLHIVENDSIKCAPYRALDLFAGRPVSIYFQCPTAQQPTTIEVTGRLSSGGKYNEKISLLSTENVALPQLYAKARISELEDLMRCSTDSQRNEQETELVELSVSHSLLTRFTAFLAVDHAEIANATGDLRKLVQPVETPAQWQQLPAAGFAMPPVPCAPAPAARSVSLFAGQAEDTVGSAFSWSEPDCAPATGSSIGASGIVRPARSQRNTGSFDAVPGSRPGGGASGGWGAGGGAWGSGAGAGSLPPGSPPSKADANGSLFDSMNLDDVQVATDWQQVLQIIERLLRVVQQLLQLKAASADCQKEIKELRQIEKEILSLSSTNHLIASHPGVAPVFKNKIVPTLKKLIASGGANLAIEQIAEAEREISLASEQISLYQPDLSLTERMKANKQAVDQGKKKRGVLESIMPFWKKNI